MKAAMFRMPATITHWMAEHSPVERRIAAALAIVVAIAVLWLAVWQPMARDVASLRIARAANVIALTHAREMAKEIGGVARSNAASARTDGRAELDRILAQQNLRSAVTSLDWRDGRARVVLAAVGYDTLIAALETLQRDAGLRAMEATLTARVEPGTIRAELTLAR
jgi:type II secretory pathway component PulM